MPLWKKLANKRYSKKYLMKSKAIWYNMDSKRNSAN